MKPEIEESKECKFCQMGVDEEGEALHWFRSGWNRNPANCHVVAESNNQDEDDQARNDYYHG